MAAIKIQSLNDIVAGYLKNLGLPAEQAPEWAAAVCGRDDVITALDERLLPAAEQLYPEKHFDKAQKVAGLKLARLLAGTGELHPGLKTDERTLAVLRQYRQVPAPVCKPGKMLPQPLEMPRLKWAEKAKGEEAQGKN